MFRAIILYVQTEVGPRWRKIVTSSQLIASATIAVVSGVWGPIIGGGPLELGDVALSLLAYGAVSFGFSVASLTLVLAIPHARFSAWLATTGSKNDRSRYQDLLFVFSWTAVAHWLLIVIVLALLAVNGTDAPLVPVGSSTRLRVSVALLSFSTSHGVFQFLVALITLAQFGRVYVGYLAQAEERDQGEVGGDERRRESADISEREHGRET